MKNFAKVCSILCGDSRRVRVIFVDVLDAGREPPNTFRRKVCCGFIGIGWREIIRRLLLLQIAENLQLLSKFAIFVAPYQIGLITIDHRLRLIFFSRVSALQAAAHLAIFAAAIKIEPIHRKSPSAGLTDEKSRS